jgi:hypothetical protein
MPSERAVAPRASEIFQSTKNPLGNLNLLLGMYNLKMIFNRFKLRVSVALKNVLIIKFDNKKRLKRPSERRN